MFTEGDSKRAAIHRYKRMVADDDGRCEADTPSARPCRAQNMKSIWPILTIAIRAFVWNRQSHSASLDEAAFEVPYLREADEVV
jgi:hypothetical protein